METYIIIFGIFIISLWTYLCVLYCKKKKEFKKKNQKYDVDNYIN